MLLRLLEDSAEDPGEVKHLAVQLKGGLRAALEDLRALARGIYPPLLAERDCAPRCARTPTRFCPGAARSDGIGSYGRDTEATAYFCTSKPGRTSPKAAGGPPVPPSSSACPDA